MEIRIRGSREECAAFVEMVRRTVPEPYIKSISGFYPDTRKCTYSNEGRVYLSFRDGIAQLRIKGGE